METVDVQKRNYKRALQFEEKIIGKNLRPIDEKYTLSKENGPYLVRNQRTNTVNNPLRAVSGTEGPASSTSIVVDFLNVFWEARCRFLWLLCMILSKKAKPLFLTAKCD